MEIRFYKGVKITKQYNKVTHITYSSGGAVILNIGRNDEIMVYKDEYDYFGIFQDQ